MTGVARNELIFSAWNAIGCNPRLEAVKRDRMNAEESHALANQTSNVSKKVATAIPG